MRRGNRRANPFRWQDLNARDEIANMKAVVYSLSAGWGHFTRRMGILIDKDHLGLGLRSWRYAMIDEGNVITHWFEKPGINDDGSDSDPDGESAPEKLSAALTSE